MADAPDQTQSPTTLRRAEPRQGHNLALAVVLVAAGVAAYANSFYGVFLFDDFTNIHHNERIRDLTAIDRVLSGQRPVLDLTLAINQRLHGLEPWGYHAVNLAVHLLAGLTLFGLLRRTLGRPSFQGRIRADAGVLAFVVALCWTLHPVQTQSVTYIIQRSEALAGLFVLLMLYSLVRGHQRQGRWYWYVGAVAACALSMGSKPTAVTAPVLALLFDRFFLAGSFLRAFRLRWKVYAALTATWGVLFVTGTITALLRSDAPGVTVGSGFTGIGPIEYLRTQAAVLVHYLMLGNALAASGRLAEAVDELQTAVRLNPTNPRARRALDRVYEISRRQ